MKQITIYEAYDGTQFTTEDECLEYEVLHNKLYKAYDWAGNKAYSATSTAVINLLELEGATAFINACEREHISYKGISENDMGVFFWDNWHDTYVYVDSDVLKILKEVI